MLIRQHIWLFGNLLDLLNESLIYLLQFCFNKKTLDIVGRLGVLHGQKSGFQLNANGEIVTTTQTAKTYNKGKSAKTNSAVAAAANSSHSGEANSTRNGHDQEPLLALFAIACPFGPPSLFELPQRESLFKTKHKINLAPISIDAK